MRSALRLHVLAGEVAQTQDRELGIASSGRISPDGRWVVVVDQIPPNVKLFDDKGVVTAALHFDRDTSTAYVAPAVAVSDSQLFVGRPDLRRIDLYDHFGNWVSTIPADFVPIAATALSDSVWFVYGPSAGDPDRMPYWAHCLYIDHGGRARWSSAFQDSTSSSHPVSVPALSSSEDTVVLGLADGTRELRATCGSRAVATETQTGLPMSSGDKRSRQGAAFLQLPGVVLRARLDESRPSSWSIGRRESRIVRTLFEYQGNDGEARTIAVPGRYELFEHRAHLGTLVAVSDPFPLLFRIDDDSLQSALAHDR